MGLKSFFQDLYSIKSNGNPVGANQVFSLFNNNRTSSGVIVNSNTAIQHSTVYACVRDKAESIGQLPVRIYKRGKDGKRSEITSGRLHRIFTQQPNEFMTMQDFSEMQITCLELYGRFFAYIARNDRGNVSEIIPFRYQQSITVNMDRYGNVYFIYATNDGKPGMSIAGENIMHIKLNTLDGFTGLGAIQCSATSIGLGIAQDVHLSSIMENGAMPSGVLETDNIFETGPALERLKSDWRDKYGGSINSGKTPLLENGVKYRALTITPADSELLEQRKYSREDICGMFRVPPHRIGATTGVKKEDIEQANKDYYVNKLMPLVRKNEAAMNAITPENIEIQVDEKGFIRGDFASLVSSADKAVKAGLVSINEGREIISYQPREGGDVHAIDTNNLTFGNLDDIPRLQEEQRALALANTEKPKENPEESEDE